MDEMKDYAVQVRVKNNWLLTRMKAAGFESAAALSRATGISQIQIGDLINLKLTGQTSREEWRQFVLKIAETLRCLPEDIIPPQHVRSKLAKNSFQLTASAEEVSGLLQGECQSPDQALEKEQSIKLIEQSLASLRPREREVMERRFGINDGLCETFQEIGDKLGVGKQRIRQIEMEAIRKLRHKSCEPAMREAFDVIVRGAD